MIASVDVRDGLVRRWDARSGDPVSEPLQSDDVLLGLALSPDGKMIAASGYSGEVHRWDANSGAVVDKLVGHAGLGSTRDDTPDSAITSIDGWPASIDAWIKHACTLVRRNLRQDEWDQCIGDDRPYYRACADLSPGQGALPEAPVARYPFG